MLVMHNINIPQEFNRYDFVLPTGIHIGTLLLPPDYAFAHDIKVLEIVTKPIAIRWGAYVPQASKVRSPESRR